ncbi:longitudinals lacking protein, isoforms F/I/K/T isoform X2 [Ceratitis capitata]|uniref:longitudinals lacking protein, isoforms F/I/K/T isoform X2 n=1 Tax=Ceratitis capitata TaxID=7213 RepID=UPI000329F08F|nr:longitudinals lacking protein, isoforms F/I/K/T isoform X2 [Ceratitis capitata]
MEDDQQFCLRWNNHQSTLISVFDTLLENQTLVDCTLAAEGQFLKAHKVVLSACSPFFATLLQQQYDKHPIFILKDVKYQELRAMMDYMYRGEVNISQDQLAALLKAAESLQIKGLSDNRSGSTPKTEQHRGLNVPASGSGAKLSGYTLEQTQSKRPRVVPSSMETADISGSREGSSSPSRRRRKIRRRSIENTMTADVHDNSNSSQMNQPLQPQQQQPQSNVSLSGVGAISAASSSLPVPASALSSASSGVLAATGSIVSTQGTQQMTTNITKKTESVKGANDVMNSENIQVAGVAGTGEDHSAEHLKGEKSNHKQKSSTTGVATKETAEMVIEPKSEYEEEGNEGTVEDLTLDDEEMGMEDLDQNAGTSQAGEGSSQGYAPWQHDRSQDDLLMAQQEAQQRDPQVKHDKSEQTDITPEEFELDDCLLESNDIVITQNKDGFVLHVKKLGNITTAKIGPTDDDQTVATSVTDMNTQAQITDVQNITDVKPTLTTLTTSPIKLPSSECELINLKKIIPSVSTIAAHQPSATIIQSHQFSQQSHPSQHQHTHNLDQQQHQIQQLQSHPQVQSIVTTHPPHTQTINLMSLRNVQIPDQKPVSSRIKYSRGKIIAPQSSTSASVQIVEAHDPDTQHHHQLTEGTKYEISEIDLNNPSASAAIISDLVKYAEIDDIELPDGTKIGIGFAPTEITEHIQTAVPSDTQIGGVDEDSEQPVHHHHHHHSHHHVQHLQQSQVHHIHPQSHHTQLQLQEQDDATTSVEATILPEGITLHEQPTITKSYTILTTRPIKQEGGSTSIDGTTTTTYELSLSDSSMHPDDGDSKYVCRHCGKKYRWKSTLRRHENVECGGKEPCHPCPHCSYKAKQRGNLGVHVRKHHPDKPALESKRGRK